MLISRRYFISVDASGFWRWYCRNPATTYYSMDDSCGSIPPTTMAMTLLALRRRWSCRGSDGRHYTVRDTIWHTFWTVAPRPCRPRSHVARHFPQTASVRRMSLGTMTSYSTACLNPPSGTQSPQPFPVRLSRAWRKARATIPHPSKSALNWCAIYSSSSLARLPADVAMPPDRITARGPALLWQFEQTKQNSCKFKHHVSMAKITVRFDHIPQSPFSSINLCIID